MNFPNFFDSRHSLNLFGLDKNFKFISNLYLKKKLPKVLMLSGKKGSGKTTLIHHFLFSIFDTKKYDKEKFIISDNSIFFNQFQSNIFSNIIYIKGEDFKSVKVEDIRNLKKKFLQTSLSSKDRFIILDDIELFNLNSLNALLKIIEEPSEKNFFLLIYNETKPLLETIKSRAVEFKIYLNENQRLEIIKKLTSFYKLELILDPKTSKLSPGNFVKFNYICKYYDITPSDNFLENLSFLLNLYKKDKNILYINLLFFFADNYFIKLRDKDLIKNEKIFEIRNYIYDNLNNFMMYNMSQSSLINSVTDKINRG